MPKEIQLPILGTQFLNPEDPSLINPTYTFLQSPQQNLYFIFLWFQVYNEQIRDLLVPSGFLPIREDPQRGVVVNRLSLHKPHSAEELMHMLEFGNRNRTQHPTDANQESSRSHAVFQVSCASDFYFDVSGCTKQ